MSKVSCQGCGIRIGPGYMETFAYQVGDYKICGWCLGQLKKWGRLQVEPYSSNLYLQPDGSVVKSLWGGAGTQSRKEV